MLSLKSFKMCAYKNEKVANNLMTAKRLKKISKYFKS